MTEPEHDNTALTLVLGGTGKTGRRVVERLTARHRPVRIGSRSAEPPFDWADQSTWPPALDRVRSAYLSFYPDLAVPGAADAVRAFADLAARQGVRRLVLLSGRGEEEAQRSEEVVMKSDLEWTIVRASWFNQNFSEGHLLEPVRGGEVVLPVGNVGEPFVDTDDIADVAVAALTEDGHVGQLYELTGPRLLTFADAVGEIAAATGRDIRFRPVSIEEYTGMLAEYELPADEVALLTYLFTEVLDGRNAHLTDGVERALGRPPRDFRDYARTVASTGLWAG
ncbi:NAD(P)H-binding protein [Plantactinospora solaniradicis]|uniref:NAD(P)H-binding protein n=1 Tax=Plantactinospora solaniradicis TaxID=1723736 RepID=A0ABW1K561_9ACTN